MKQSFLFSQLIFFALFLFAASLQAQWVQVSGSYGGHTQCIAADDTNLFAGTAAGVFRSTNNGNSWTSANAGLTASVTAFAVRRNQTGGSNLFAGTQTDGVFLSTNNGSKWIAVNNGLEDLYITSLATNRSSIFAGGHYVFRSTDNGRSWSSVSGGIFEGIACLAANDSLIIASTFFDRVFRSTDNGNTWALADSGLRTPRPVRTKALYSILISDSSIYGGTLYGVYRSTDNGLSWRATGTIPLSGNTPVNSLVAIGSDIFASTGVGIFYSSNSGTNWTQVSGGLPKDLFGSPTIYSLTTQGSTLFAGTIAGVFYSTDLGMHWRGLNTGLNASSVNTLTVDGSNLFSDAGSGYFIQRSTNNGTSWTVVNDTVYNHYRHLVSKGSYVVAATDGLIAVAFHSPILRSNDLGASWTSLGNQDYTALAMNEKYIFSGALFGSEGVRRCAVDSTTWTLVDNGLPEFPGITAFVVNGSNIFAGTYPYGIFYSSNNGIDWKPLNGGWGENLAITAIAVSGTTIFAGTAPFSSLPQTVIGRGIFRSTDFGESWTPVNNGLTDTGITALVIHDSALLAGTNSGVFLSTNNGTTWTPFNAGLPSLAVSALALNETYVYAGIFGGVWRRPLSEIITAAQSAHENVLGQFRLEQNYPNPFNPTTIIKYSLAKPSRVTLKIFNLVGEEVATLVNSQQTPGDHEIFWRAENFSSGIYYYQLRIDNNLVQTRKLVLLK